MLCEPFVVVVESTTEGVSNAPSGYQVVGAQEPALIHLAKAMITHWIHLTRPQGFNVLLCCNALCIVSSCDGHKQRAHARDVGLFSDMAMGRAMGPEQPDPQTTGPSRTSRPPVTVPEEIRKLWDLLPRRERQRRRRRFFREHPACCSRPVIHSTLATIDTRVRMLEEALAEFLHATATSIPVPPTSSAKKRDREGAELPSSSTPANTVGETLPDIPSATEAARNAASPSPTTSDFTSAAVPCALHGAALHGPEPSGKPPHSVTPHSTASHGLVSSNDTLHSAAPHEATSHSTASVPSDTVNIFQHLPWYRDAVANNSASDTVADLVSRPRFHLHGIHSGWRAVTHSDSDSE